MTKEEYAEALKKVKAKPKDKTSSYMKVSLGYSTTFILDYKKGLDLINAMEGAESLNIAWSEAPTLSKDLKGLTFEPMAESQYNRIQAAILLNIPLSEVPEELK